MRIGHKRAAPARVDRAAPAVSLGGGRQPGDGGPFPKTVKAENQSRLDEFQRTSNDMKNLLDSTEIVSVFLGSELRVRRFTSGANRIFKLLPGDVGRPLTDITVAKMLEARLRATAAETVETDRGGR